MIRLTPFAAVLLLIACASPKERCLSRAQPDLRTIDAAIFETEANLERGYALAPPAIDSVNVRFCTGGNPTVCLDSHSDVAGRPVAIDEDAERQKLQSLYRQRSELQAKAAADIAVCNSMDG